MAVYCKHDRYKGMLLNSIQNASNMTALTDIFRKLPLEDARDLLSEHIKNTEVKECSLLYFKSQSIVDILSTDVCREIVKFNELSEVYDISKQFQDFANKERVRRSSLISLEFPCIRSADCVVENSLSLARAVSKASRGCAGKPSCTIFLRDGEYRLPHLDPGNFQLIGTGDSVAIHPNFTIQETSVYFKNIKFIISGEYGGYQSMWTERNCRVWMEKCQFGTGDAKRQHRVILQIGSGDFSAKHCKFFTTREAAIHGMSYKHCAARIRIVNSIFIEIHGRSQLNYDVRPIELGCIPKKAVSFKCCGNIFLGPYRNKWTEWSKDQKQMKKLMKGGVFEQAEVKQRFVVKDNVFLNRESSCACCMR